MTREKKLKPDLPSGFVDRKGSELKLKDKLTEIIKKNFQLYGYEQISTPSFEFSENIGKFLPDEDRPNSGVFGFKDGKDWLSLKYDLTAPLARFYSANETLISRPFKRFQLGNVWRNEKPGTGKGRFREFTQIDADIVGTNNILADVEMTVLLADSLNKCGLDNEEFVIRVSNRKCFFGMLDWVGITNDKQRISITRVVDKYDRLGIKGVASLLGKGRVDESGDSMQGVGLNQKQIEKIIKYIEENTLYDTERENMRGSARFAPLGSYDELSPLYEEGLKELRTIFDNTELSEFKNQIVYSPTLVRGIEYYTGNIFEANLLFKVKNQKGQEVEFGSIGGGGRYDTLVSKFSNNPAPSVGVSIGLDRLLIGIQQKDNFFKKNKIENFGPVVICLFDQTNMAPYYKILNMLRTSGVNSEIYTGDGGIKAQMKYADRRNSPAVILYGENEAKSGTVTIKNLNVGKKSSEEIKTREDWKSNESAQTTIKFENLLDEIKKIIKSN